MIELATTSNQDAAGKPTTVQEGYVHYIQKLRYVVLFFGCVLALGLIPYWISVFGKLKSGGFDDPTSESATTSILFDTLFADPNPSNTAILQHPGWNVTNPKFRSQFYNWKNALGRNVQYYGMLDYFDYPQHTSLISDDGTKLVVYFRGTDGYPYSVFDTVSKRTSLTCSYGGDNLANDAISSQLQQDLSKIEYAAGPILIVLLVVVYGGIIAVIPPLMLAVWTLSLTFTAINLLASSGFSVTTYVTDVAIAFGVGIAIDYSLFLHLRFSEELAKMPPGATPEDERFILKLATEKSIGTSGRTVIFSAILLMSTLSGALQFNMFYLTTMAATMLFIAFTSSLGALTIVPAFYLSVGRGIFSLSTSSFMQTIQSVFNAFVTSYSDGFNPSSASRTRKHEVVPQTDSTVSTTSPPKEPSETVSEYQNEGTVSPQRGTLVTEEDLNNPWYIFIDFIVQNPWPFLIVVLGCFAALAATFVTNVRLVGFDWTNLPVNSPVRYTYETEWYQFKKNGPSKMDIFIQINGTKITASKALSVSFLTQLDAFCGNLENQTFVRSVASMVRLSTSLTLQDYINIYTNPNVPSNTAFIAQTKNPLFIYNGFDITRVTIYSNTALNDPSLDDTVRYVRSLLKKSFTYSDGTSMLVQSGVTGNAAVQYDNNNDLAESLPALIIVVVVAMFVFVLLLTGSLFLPLKAIVTSGLNVMASFAFLMFVFQYGSGAAALNFRNNFNSLDPTILLFIFVVGFGLSLDYEVFILGRIQEIYLKTGDCKYAISKGVSSSARAVTSAAVLLCVAICGFLSSSVLVLQLIGLGIGLIVMLDATVIRCVLIPAVLAVAGDWAWYAPYPIKKGVEFCGIRH